MGSDGGGALHGHLLVGNGWVVDGDTRDPQRALIKNDTFETAQTLADGGAAVGYLGPLGNGADTTDVYRVDLDKGETVSLYPAADYDLALYSSAGNLVDDSLGSGGTEVVMPRSAGTYFVRVSSASPRAGLYALTVGTSTPPLATTAARGRLSTTYAFRPSEALVKLRSGVSATSFFARAGLTPFASAPRSGGFTRVAIRARTLQTTASVPGAAKERTIAAIRDLRSAPEVQWAEPNYVRQVQFAPPDDPLYASQWNAGTIHVLDAWDTSQGSGAVVAVIDTGVKRSHPDWENVDHSTQLLAGYDMIADAAVAADGDGRDADPEDPGDREFGDESSWHGTHVAGIIAAATNNARGCAGIAPLAKILPVRAFGVGGGTTDDIVQGILYAAGLPNDANTHPSRRADVINLSFSGPGASRATAEAVAAARSAGVIVVAAAGNDGTDVAGYSPAGEPGVVAVGAVDLRRTRAPYSNYGTRTDVVAPGGDMSADADKDGQKDGITSLVYASGGSVLYLPHDGTSMASAHVAGVVALMKSVYPGLSPASFDALLAGAGTPLTEDIGNAGKDAFFGFGLIDAKKAVDAARSAASEPPPATPTLRVSTAELAFGGWLGALPLVLENAGQGTLRVESVTASAPWIAIAPGALGDNTVSVDRSTLSPGTQSGTLTVRTNGGDATITVTVRATPHASGGDIGSVVVRLLDDGRAIVGETRTDATAGYAFALKEVPPGEYSLVAGTDLDGDGVLDEKGEAFGAYPSTERPTFVVIPGANEELAIPMSVDIHE